MRGLSTLLLMGGVAVGQSAPRVYTDADYAKAEAQMPYNVNPLVLHAVDDPVWLADGRMVYRDLGVTGRQWVVVDPAKGTRGKAFDQVKLATALSTATGKKIEAGRIPMQGFALRDGEKTVDLVSDGKRWSCSLGDAPECKAADAGVARTLKEKGKAKEGDVSPDGTRAAFIRDWNLWVRDRATGKETQLTTDGVKDFGYATDNAGWQHSDNPILVWSPDGKKIATFQQDQRKTGELYLTNVTNGHPTLTTLKYPLVGDKDVTMIERVVLDVDKRKVVRLKMPPDQHRSTICDDVSCSGKGWDDVQWSADGQTLAFVSTSRDHKQEWVRVADAKTGAVREVMTETAPKFFESGFNQVNWHYLSATNELLWFSEKSGWGQLYLYDMATGKEKLPVTAGLWNVTKVLGVDEKSRTIYFEGVGKEDGLDPYYTMYYRVGFDGKELTLLTPERSHHVITPSPDNRYFVDVYSTPIEPQVAVVRDNLGKVVVEVAREDIGRLKAKGWIAPIQIQVKGRDGVTDIYGLMFTPTTFSTDRKYPMINHVYPGPQVGSCGPRNFLAAHGDSQALAELGFIVICLDGMGTPERSKAFHEAYFADLGDNTIPDQVAGMKQLADRYPWIDLTRVGIYGHSGGGNATAAAMFHYPDFFKAGIAESGNHDNRDYEDDWAEKWAGLLVKNPDGTSNYDSQANQATARNLKGHLLLAHGTSDDNVPPSNTLLVVDALIKANKDFDLLMIPSAKHGYGAAAQYMTRRRWDYFVVNVGGDIAPHEYRMKPYAETQRLLGMPVGPADVDWDDDLSADTD